MEREQQCAMCGRRGNRGFVRESLLNVPGTTEVVCKAKTACMHRYKENRRLEALSRPGDR